MDHSDSLNTSETNNTINIKLNEYKLDIPSIYNQINKEKLKVLSIIEEELGIIIDRNCILNK